MEVTTSQAADLLQVARRTIQFYIRTGKLSAQRRGLRKFTINLDELRMFAKTNQTFFDEDLAQQLVNK